MNNDKKLDKDNKNILDDKAKNVKLIKESIQVDKVNEAVSEVTVEKDVEFFDEVLEIPITKEELSIDHIPIGEVVEQYPVVREEDGKTIIPVVKERLVVTKQLYLEEEIHITKKTSEEIQEVKETLRKDTVNIERKKL